MQASNDAFSPFINKYSLSKTLRFELRPQGKTQETFSQWASELREDNQPSEANLLHQDEVRAEDYSKVKKIIDEFHKFFLNTSLAEFQFDLELLENYKSLYFNASKTTKDEKSFEQVKTKLRAAIANAFAKGVTIDFASTNERHEIKTSSLKKKELITELIPLFLDNYWTDEIAARLEEHEINNKKEAKDLVESFNRFTTYFKGFHENRANMYVKEEKSTAVAFRLIHENLPRFLDNEKLLHSILERHPNFDLEMVDKELEPVLNGASVQEYFSLPYFNYCISQTGIEQYNTVLGGWTEEGQIKVKGLNEAINLYRQKHQLKKAQMGNATPLYKQILSDRESVSFLPEIFENDDEVFLSIEKFIENEYLISRIDESISLPEALISLMEQLKFCDLSRVYVSNGVALTHMSQVLFSDWSSITRALEKKYIETSLGNSKLNDLKKDEKAHAAIKKLKAISLADIDEALQFVNQDKQDALDYFTGFNSKSSDNLLEATKEAIEKFKLAAEKRTKDTNALRQKKKNNHEIEVIKNLLDSFVNLIRFIKPLNVNEGGGEKDETFYNDYHQLYDQLNLVTPLYNKVRNYITQKPYSKEKFPLNFENNTLLDGWDKNKERANSGVLLLKEGKYYLGIMKFGQNKSFIDPPVQQELEGAYQKMNYKLLPGPDKMLPKVFFSKKNIEYFKPDDTILAIRNHSEHTKNGNPQKGYKKKEFSVKAAHQMIDFFKESLDKHKDWKNFNFSFSATENYKDTSDFYREINEQGYILTFDNIPEEYIQELVNKGDLFLFQVYNKDFSPHSKGTPNLHTLYWKALFDENNLSNLVYKLNGEAEIFYRKRSIDPKKAVVHKAGEPITNKSPNTENTTSTFDYDIIKDRRFTVDKFQFHVPITLNTNAEGREYLNEEVTQYLRNNPHTHVIGIDRGERHLLYLTLTNRKGQIVKQMTLNEILSSYTSPEGETKQVAKNYHDLLEKREKGRDEARKSWSTIENIKELKEGYLSQVVHKIALMVVEYNAIVVLEDLNMGFKRGRQKVEKQVYQKFEKMLIDKLNYLVFKNEAWDKPGGLLKAYQLTGKFTSFKKMGKQNGILFFVPPSFTSKIDPITGFVNFFYNRYESVAKSQLFFEKFDDIRYNKEKDWFEFSFDYNNFQEKAKDTKSKWTICTKGERIRTFRNKEKNNQFDSETVDLTYAFKKHFKSFGIDVEENLQTEILKQDSKDFFAPLMHLFRLTVQMRNSKTGTDEDYMISPVAPFYDSREEANKGLDTDGSWKAHLPADADANGAYHIALKGVMLLDRMSKVKTDEKLDLKISKVDWLAFVQE